MLNPSAKEFALQSTNWKGMYVHRKLCNGDKLQTIEQVPIINNSSAVKGSIIATTIAAIGEPEEDALSNPDLAKVKKDACFCCSGRHSLQDCKQFKEKRHKEKMFLLRRNGVCFGCLGVGHMSRDGGRRLTCQGCNLNHPTE